MFLCFVEIPSSVEEIVITEKTESSVTLRWNPPIRHSDQDVLYDITCRKCPPSTYFAKPCRERCGSSVTFVPSDENLRETYVTIQGLEENTEYQFVIFSKNQNSLRIHRSNWQGRNANIITDGMAILHVIYFVTRSWSACQKFSKFFQQKKNFKILSKQLCVFL
jgi:hypothetical protein